MYNNSRRAPEHIYSVSLAAGIAAREFTFQSPNFTCRISHFDSAVDTTSGTDFPSWSVRIGSTIKITQAGVVTADTVTRTIAMDAGQDDIVPANSRIQLVLVTAGTAANALGLAARLSLIGTN